MDCSITHTQLKRYAESEQEVLSMFGTDEDNDPLGYQFNRALVELDKRCHSRLSFKIGLEYLFGDFSEFRDSPLSRYVAFDDFYEILYLAHRHNIKNKERNLFDAYVDQIIPDRTTVVDFKEMAQTLIEVSTSVEELYLALDKLYLLHKEYTRKPPSEEIRSFKDYIYSRAPEGSFDVSSMIQEKKSTYEFFWKWLETANDKDRS